MPKSQSPEEWWQRVLTGNNPDLPLRHFRNFFRRLPTGPRCQFCNAPYHGFGAPLMRIMGKSPSRLSPHLCQQCQSYASQQLGGAEIELTMLFADVRGSTTLGEKMSPGDFSKLISCFFGVASEALAQNLAWVDRFVGDQVVGYFVPGFAGADHARKAIVSGQEILKLTGHSDPAGPWIPVGIGVHTGGGVRRLGGGAGAGNGHHRAGGRAEHRRPVFVSGQGGGDFGQRGSVEGGGDFGKWAGKPGVRIEGEKSGCESLCTLIKSLVK